MNTDKKTEREVENFLCVSEQTQITWYSECKHLQTGIIPSLRRTIYLSTATFQSTLTEKSNEQTDSPHEYPFPTDREILYDVKFEVPTPVITMNNQNVSIY
jgi:hypothetical protein